MATHRAKPKAGQAAKADKRKTQEQKIAEALRRDAESKRERNTDAGKPEKKPRESSQKAPPRPAAPPDPHRKRRIGLRVTFGVILIGVVAALGVTVSKLAEKVGGIPEVVETFTLTPKSLKQITSVPDDVFDEVGAGSAKAVLKKVSAPALTEGGKPRFLFVCAESRPECASARWPVAVALSRFGTWEGLAASASPRDGLYPNTPTLTFHGAAFTSKYLAFTGVETEGRVRTNGAYPTLDTLSPADAATFENVNAAPYVSPESVGLLPFFNLAGRYVGVGSGFGTQLLSGNTHAEIAAALSKPTSYLARAIDGSANVLTAAICAVLGAEAPSDVCTSTGVEQAKNLLKVRR